MGMLLEKILRIFKLATVAILNIMSNLLSFAVLLDLQLKADQFNGVHWRLVSYVAFGEAGGEITKVLGVDIGVDSVSWKVTSVKKIIMCLNVYNW